MFLHRGAKPVSSVKAISVILIVLFVLISFWNGLFLRDLRYPMVAAARNGDLDKIAFWSHFGLEDQHFCDLINCGNSAIEVAASAGQLQAVGLLLDKGANICGRSRQVFFWESQKPALHKFLTKDRGLDLQALEAGCPKWDGKKWVSPLPKSP